jgi:hypothetical protein
MYELVRNAWLVCTLVAITVVPTAWVALAIVALVSTRKRSLRE